MNIDFLETVIKVLTILKGQTYWSLDNIESTIRFKPLIHPIDINYTNLTKEGIASALETSINENTKALSEAKVLLQEYRKEQLKSATEALKRLNID
jgi:hypothetical protein